MSSKVIIEYRTEDHFCRKSQNFVIHEKYLNENITISMVRCCSEYRLLKGKVRHCTNMDEKHYKITEPIYSDHQRHAGTTSWKWSYNIEIGTVGFVPSGQSRSPMLFDLGVLMDFLTEKLFTSTFRSWQLVKKSSRHIVINSLTAPIYWRHDSECQTKNTSAKMDLPGKR